VQVGGAAALVPADEVDVTEILDKEMMLTMGARDDDEEDEAAEPGEEGAVEWADWADHTIDLRKQAIPVPPTWPAEIRIPDGAPFVQNSTEIHFFDLAFPREYIKEVIVPVTQGALPEFDEAMFWNYLACRFVMAGYTGVPAAQFWKMQHHRFKPIPFLGGIMSRKVFEKIGPALGFALPGDEPAFDDPFWEVRVMQDRVNGHLAITFRPSWRNVGDESINSKLDPKNCPGFMCVGRKPHPFGNEYHTNCCAETKIMFFMEIVEGKVSPCLRARKCDTFSDTVSSARSAARAEPDEPFSAQRV
jgi:hypothetical protein